MKVLRKDLGYCIYSRFEESFRRFISHRLLQLSGLEWKLAVPQGITLKVQEKASNDFTDDTDDPALFLEETGLPDLAEIVCFKGNYLNFFDSSPLSQAEFQNLMGKLNDIRIKIAHVKRTFSALDFDLLVEIATTFKNKFGDFGKSLEEALTAININPDSIAIEIPATFLLTDESLGGRYLNNVPEPDYGIDGGFIGRKEDLLKIKNLLIGGIQRVVTISGAGGVGKTAVAHEICRDFLTMPNMAFDAIVWVSAKEERLGLTIQQIEPQLKNFDGLLESILETFGFSISASLDEKISDVNIILLANTKGILLVVDNLETIDDERIKDFLKDIPPPNKVLITSRLGLGEVERRHPLTALNRKDSIILLRTIATEKSAGTLAKLPDDVLGKYVDKMARYPLAIKWVVGQVALGKDIDQTIKELMSPEGDVAKFCFEHIFENLLKHESKMTLYALAANEKPITRGVITHIANLDDEQVDMALRELSIASLIIISQIKSSGSSIETRYELLQLTRNYIRLQLQSNPQIAKSIQSRIEMVQNVIEESERAGKQYRYSLSNMGAKSEEEKIAATWAITGYQKSQGGDYDGAIKAFVRATQIAPNFSAIYRNWASIEADAGFQQKADELMKRAVSLDADDPQIWFVWGNIEKRATHYEKAYEYLKRATELSPDDGVFLHSLGEVEKRRGNYENAHRLLRNAMQLHPSESKPIRHEIIILTTMADNLRRWAESLSRHGEQVLDKLKEAEKLAEQACKLGKDDIRAQDTLSEITLNLGYELWRNKDSFKTARPYFEACVRENAKRWVEQKATSRACYVLASMLIEANEIEAAKKYFHIGRRFVGDNVSLQEKYKSLEYDFVLKRQKGVLIRIIPRKGFGFLEIEGTGSSIFVHFSEIVPKIAMQEFEELKNERFSFASEIGEKGPQAKRARRIPRNN